MVLKWWLSLAFTICEILKKLPDKMFAGLHLTLVKMTAIMAV